MKGVELRTGDVLLSEPYASRHPFAYGFHKALVALPQGRLGRAHAAVYDRGHIIESDIRTGVVRLPFDKWKKNNNFEVFRPKMAPTPKRLDRIRSMVGADYNLSAAIKAGIAPSLYKSDSKNGIICSGIAGNLYPEVAKEKKRHRDVLLPTHFAESKHMKKVSYKHTFSGEVARNAQWALDGVNNGRSKAMLSTGRTRQLTQKEAMLGVQKPTVKPPALPKIKPPRPPQPNMASEQRKADIEAHQVGSTQMASQKKLNQNMDEVWRSALISNRAAMANAGGGV